MKDIVSVTKNLQTSNKVPLKLPEDRMNENISRNLEQTNKFIVTFQAHPLFMI